MRLVDGCGGRWDGTPVLTVQSAAADVVSAVVAAGVAFAAVVVAAAAADFAVAAVTVVAGSVSGGNIILSPRARKF